MTKVTVVPYMYRDANNFKAYGQVVLTGAITEAQLDALKASLEVDDTFIPEQIGMSHLGYSEETWTSFPHDDDDHPFHELFVAEITVTDEVAIPGAREGTVDAFVKRFTDVGPDGWDAGKYALEGD